MHAHICWIWLRHDALPMCRRLLGQNVTREIGGSVVVPWRGFE